MTSTAVALIGVGKMGAAFVDRWKDAGQPVVLWNRTAATAQALAGDGVTVADSVSDAVGDADIVVTMVISGEALRAILIDQGGLAAMKPGSVLVDLSTVDVPSSVAVAEAAAAAGVKYLRGAVSGTPPVVRAGNASLLLSGPTDAYESAKAALDPITEKQSVVGDAEEARIVKIAVNSMLGGTTQLLAEATALAEASGVSREVFLDALDATVMSSMFVSYKGAALRARNYAPTFATAGMQKDIALAISQGESVGVPMAMSNVVLDQLGAAVDAGYGEDDFLSLFCVVQAAAGMPVDAEPST